MSRVTHMRWFNMDNSHNAPSEYLVEGTIRLGFSYFSQAHGPISQNDSPTMDELHESELLSICTACGTQYDTTYISGIKDCRICDDPRQFIPPSGQTVTTLAALKKTHHNKWEPFKNDDRFWSLYTEPKFSIGQRAILVRTPKGNILWDCITLLDNATKEWIHGLGGLAAIVISHPHYYTTHLVWAEEFDCPVYVSWEDKIWLNRLDRMGVARTFIESQAEELEIRGEKTGVHVLKLGGHFPGSLVFLYDGRLLIADTLVTVPSGLYHINRPKGTTSFSFMWSIPNMIPLPPDEIAKMWAVLKNYNFTSTYGAFVGIEIESPEVKGRVLESMKIQIRAEGHRDHPLLSESWNL